MPIEKKPCVNNPKYQYSGKEESPLGLGYAPDGELTSLYMKGRDSRTWMRSMKNGVPVWVRVPDDVANLGKDAPIIDNPPGAPVKAPKELTDPKDEDETHVQPRKLDFTEDEKPVEKPKKKVVKKKTEDVSSDTVKPPAEEDTKPKKAPAKKASAKKADDGAATEKRPLSNYQKFMSWRMAQLKESQPGNKGNFSQVAAEWKAMSDSDKVAIMERVNA